jgi:hypothetical protein
VLGRPEQKFFPLRRFFLRNWRSGRYHRWDRRSLLMDLVGARYRSGVFGIHA